MNARKRVIVIGAGFAGLDAVHEFSKATQDVDVLLIDRNNYHTFTPLLYQVATCGLDPSAISHPIRPIFRKQKNVQFVMGDVTGIDYQNKTITLNASDEIRQEAYDYLLIATGSKINYFGMENLAKYAFGLKDLDDAIAIRQHILKLFERATLAKNIEERDALTTFVVVGGGPTGIETAGALYELYNYVLKHEYGTERPPLQVRVILLEASDKLLAPYPKHLQEAAKQQLESLGVEVMLNATLQDLSATDITLKDGRKVGTYTLVWSAGVKASPVVSMLDLPLERMNRLPVEDTLKVPNRDGIYAAGDLTYIKDPKGELYAMVIQVARQQGLRAAKNILHAIRGEKELPFVYNDLGIMATIGRRRAVAWLFNRIPLSGFIAWIAWLFLHLLTLMGFRNRASVFINWVWNYLTYDRSVRIILHVEKLECTPEPQTPATV
jgi:NADH:ubiquinone reductase (H+-translocating)